MKKGCRISLLSLFVVLSLSVFSQTVWTSTGNPIIRHLRTADPSCHVWSDGKLWVYASHDQDTATDYASMDGYHVFSTPDLVTWTDHGEMLHSKNVPWVQGGYMWAPDCAFKNGKYYFYFPSKDKTGGFRIGVAISTNPAGPFIPEANYIQGTSGTDPCCFIDDDGVAYLYFGSSKVARLKDNMIELDETPRTVNYGTTGLSFEGSWMHKRNGKYYYSWTDFKASEQGLYSMGDSPYGPFVYKGAMTGRPGGAQDHHSIFEFKNQWYYFYHVGNYNGGSGNRRNVCAEYLSYNVDGTIKRVVYTSKGVSAPAPQPLRLPGKIEAEAYSSMSGINTENTTDMGGGSNIGNIENGDWVEYTANIDKSFGEYWLAYRVATVTSGGTIDFEVNGNNLGTVVVKNTGGWQKWVTSDSIKISLTGGVDTKFRLKFKGGSGGLLNINWFTLNYIDPTALHPVNEKLPITIFRNSAMRELSFAGIEPGTTINIFNANGHLVYSNQAINELITINTALFSKGVYIIKLQKENSVAIRKFNL